MNGLRKVKTFIKDEGHADFYPGFKINYIPGKPPEIVCFKGEEEVERIDLSKMETQEIHDLVKGKGYKRVMPLSLAAKAAKGEEVTQEDWATYLEARAQRSEARKQWEADGFYRQMDALDAVRASSGEAPVGFSGRWLVARQKDELPNTAGVQYRNSMDLADKAPDGHMAKWGSTILGEVAAEGWLKIVDAPNGEGTQFLPFAAGKVRILRLVPDAEVDAHTGAKSDEL